MKLIVGLGNPGKDYIYSRHNIGFLVIKALAKIHGALLRREIATFSLNAKDKIRGQNVILAIPLTFMNLSGIAVSALLKKYKIDLGNLLVICDDLDLEFGRVKIRVSGSSGGHLGLRSIIDSLECQNFCRLRLGIGRPKNDIEPAEYVLSAFSKKEKREIKEIEAKAVSCCQVWVTRGITECMNNFNRRSQIYGKI